VMIGVIAHVIVVVVGWSASWLFPANGNLNDEMTFWGWMEKRKTSRAEKIISTAAMEVNP